MPEKERGAVENPSSTLITFKPRQVLLAEQHEKPSSAKPTLMALAEKKKQQHYQHTKTLTGDEKTRLLHSVLRYLESNHFSKSLKRLLKDAHIQDEDWKAGILNLEDIYCTYLENCNNVDVKLASHKELEKRVHELEQHGDAAASPETRSKKKKQNDVKDNNDILPDSENISSHKDTELDGKLKSKKDKKMDSLGEANLNSACDSQVNESSKEKEKKKNKHKLTSKSLARDAKQSDSKSGLESLGEANLSSACDSLVDKASKEKEKKKNKHKLTSKSLDQDAKQSDLKSGLSEEKLKNDNGDDLKETAKSKDKKKKNKPTTECLTEDQKLNESKNSTILLDNKSNSDIPLEESEVKPKEKKKKKEGKEKKSFVTSEIVPDVKKRKRSASTENESEPVDELVRGETKRRKTEGLEEAKNVEQNDTADKLPGHEHIAEKESKGENGEVDVNDGKEISNNRVGESTNGISKNGIQNSGQKKQRNGSAEPKTVNAFRRVKADEVDFVDERLRDNSYWAKDGAETGYGAKAQETLGQVRGRDFRHEKTKKKRGSYRGGQIDLQSHSIKFNYSDEE